MRLLLDIKGRKYIVEDGEDLHCNLGQVKAQDIEDAGIGGLVRSNKGDFLNVLEPTTLDFIEKAKRGPQAMTLKDMCLAAGNAMLKSGSKVVEAGTGSGLFTMYLAHVIHPEPVVTYELREDFFNIARKNFTRFGIKNITQKRDDIYEGIAETDLDAVLLDLAEPWLVVPHLEAALKVGGILVSYSPSINQSRQITDVLDGFGHFTFETLLRYWKADRMSPDTRMLGHTGFLTVARKLRQPKRSGSNDEDAEIPLKGIEVPEGG